MFFCIVVVLDLTSSITTESVMVSRSWRGDPIPILSLDFKIIYWANVCQLVWLKSWEYGMFFFFFYLHIVNRAYVTIFHMNQLLLLHLFTFSLFLNNDQMWWRQSALVTNTFWHLRSDSCSWQHQRTFSVLTSSHFVLNAVLMRKEHTIMQGVCIWLLLRHVSFFIWIQWINQNIIESLK